ncbi:uncharacterized protein LOC128398154 [Panonychus citri]|uniref:uncharacterized protein LOC128398154 n=1 Tax=Panonychus citri TaxID=50023 RepID=UPI00230772AA|nr:uncharacterized protein LOC128398154 [Panonychus citri]
MILIVDQPRVHFINEFVSIFLKIMIDSTESLNILDLGVEQDFDNVLIKTIELLNLCLSCVAMSADSIFNNKMKNLDRVDSIPRDIHRTRMELYLTMASENDYEIKFSEIFRLNHKQFDWLISKCSNLERSKWPIRYKVIIYLEWISSKATIRQLERLFDVPKSTVQDSLDFVLSQILSIRDQLISLPKVNECFVIANGFSRRHKRKNFHHNIVGAVDGTLIEIMVPTERVENYFDRHSRTSMNLTIVSDHRNLIRYAITGISGARHDANVLKDSMLYQKSLYPPPGFIILGDSAYPNSFSPIPIISPYRNETESMIAVHKEKYNEAHSSARNVVECTFGDLKSKWRRLRDSKLIVKLEKAADVIISSVILNNLTLIDLDQINSVSTQENSELTDDEYENDLPEPKTFQFNNANDYRDLICNKLI